jgi:hypothetical protein
LAWKAAVIAGEDPPLRTTERADELLKDGKQGVSLKVRRDLPWLAP